MSKKERKIGEIGVIQEKCLFDINLFTIENSTFYASSLQGRIIEVKVTFFT